MSTIVNKVTSSFAIVTLCIFLVACSSTKIENVNKPNKSDAVTKTIATPQEQKLPKVFTSIRTALDSGKQQKAKEYLSEIPLASLSSYERIHYDILGAEIAWRKGDLSEMDDHLALLQEKTPLNLLLKRFSGERKSLIKVIFRVLKEDPTKPERIALQKILWVNLLKLKAIELSKMLSQTKDNEFNAWLNLSLLIKTTHPLDLHETLLNLPISSLDYPTLKPLPGGLESIMRGAIKDQSVNVALLLPLSGRLAPAAEAIRDGFLEAYFHARNQYKESEVHILDTTKYMNITEAFVAATELGAQYVVGPLEKKHVSSLEELDRLPLPTLALNRSVKDTSRNHADLNQLSLSPEDEATQIADIAFAKGFRKSLIISPQDIWGKKMSSTLSKRWIALGGKILAKIELAEPASYSEAIEQILHLKQSQARIARISKIIGSALNFELRRREDIDVIFLLAGSSEQARATAPLLNFHFAGDLPQYATSKIYYGRIDERDRDLNGIKLVDMPELLDSTHLTRENNQSASNSTSLRLHALGLDAFILQYFLNLHKTSNGLIFLGHSGLISIQNNGQIIREAMAAKFIDGKLVRD